MKKHSSSPLRSLFIIVSLFLLAACSSTNKQKEYSLGWAWPPEEAKLEAWSEVTVGPDNVFYLFGSDRALHAVKDGQELWQHKVDSYYVSNVTLSPDGKTIYFTTYEQKLFALDTEGNVRWVFESQEPFTFRTTPNVAPDGNVYLNTESGGYRVSPDGQGEAFPWPEWVDPMSVQFDEQGRLYMSGLFNLQLLDAGGQVLSKCETYMMSTFLAKDGQFFYTDYVPDKGTELMAMDAACAQTWSFQTGMSCGEEWDCPVVITESGTIFMGGEYGQIYALSQSRGSVQWQKERNESAGDVLQLAADEETLYAFSSQGRISAYQAKSGKELWSRETQTAGQYASLVLTSDRQLAVVQSGRVYLYTDSAPVVLNEPTPVPPPASEAETEQEIVAFLLEDITHSTEYVVSKGEPWNDPPPSADIIVWMKGGRMAAFDVSGGKPFKVWWYFDGKLVETEDLSTSIKQYEKLYIDVPSEDYEDPTWGYYDFDILSISEDRQEAEVYMGVTGGPLSGEGTKYTLRRGRDGKWQIIRSETLWVS